MPELHTHPGRYYIYYTTVVSCGWWYHNLMSDTVYCKGVFGTVPVFSVPVWMSHRTYRSVRYRYWCRTELTDVSGTGMKVCTGTGGTGIPVVPNIPKWPLPLWMYRSYPSVRYRYWCRTEHTEVTTTGMDVPNLPKCPVPVLRSYRTYRSARYR